MNDWIKMDKKELATKLFFLNTQLSCIVQKTSCKYAKDMAGNLMSYVNEIMQNL